MVTSNNHPYECYIEKPNGAMEAAKASKLAKNTICPCNYAVYPKASIPLHNDGLLLKPLLHCTLLAKKLSRICYAIFSESTENCIVSCKIVIFKIHCKSYPYLPIELEFDLRLLTKTIKGKFRNKFHLSSFIFLCFLCYYSHMNKKSHFQRAERQLLFCFCPKPEIATIVMQIAAGITCFLLREFDSPDCHFF